MIFNASSCSRGSAIACTGIGFLFILVSGSDAVAADNPDTPRLHPLEQFCVTSEMQGMMSGTWIECGRDYGYERYELQNTVIKMGPITQTDNKRVLYVGPKIYTVNDDGSATVADNPMYDSTVAALENSDPMELATSLLSSMGFTSNGETMDVAGLPCGVAAGPLGLLCMTDDGLVLYMSTMGLTRTATSVDVDSSGDEANFAVPDNPQQAPDFSNLSDLLQGLGGTQN